MNKERKMRTSKQQGGLIIFIISIYALICNSGGLIAGVVLSFVTEESGGMPTFFIVLCAVMVVISVIGIVMGNRMRK